MGAAVFRMIVHILSSSISSASRLVLTGDTRHLTDARLLLTVVIFRESAYVGDMQDTGTKTG